MGRRATVSRCGGGRVGLALFSRRVKPLWLAASTLVRGGGGGGGEGGKEILGLPSAPSYRTQGHVFQAVKHDTLSKGECVDPAYVPAP